MTRYRVSSFRRMLHLSESDALARKDTLCPWVSLAMFVATLGREKYLSHLQGTQPIENILETVMSPRKMGELERSIALDQFSQFLGCSRRQGWLPKLIGKHKSCLAITVKKKIGRTKCKKI
ncbi:hypothetical protein TNCV_1301051 [Trichonephila clavipes]|nr:hypothetical protein TNCV_1301051 [Trichonephila clavipes]